MMCLVLIDQNKQALIALKSLVTDTPEVSTLISQFSFVNKKKSLLLKSPQVIPYNILG